MASFGGDERLRLAQDIVAHGEIGDEEQPEQRPLWQLHVHDALADKVHRDEQDGGDDDADE